jgi:hypothetical protein
MTVPGGLVMHQAKRVTIMILLFSQALAAGESLGLKNQKLLVKLSTPISTKGSRIGDALSAQVIEPAKYANAIVEGHIKSITAPHGKQRAEISFAFETITIGGKTYLITADLKEIVANSKGVKQVDEEGQVIGVKSNKKKIAGTLAGAGIGAVVGGLAGGGKGAAAGGAAGAVTGYLLSVTFSANGSNIEFAPGSEFLLVTSDRNKAG